MCDFRHVSFEICIEWDRRACGFTGFSDDGSGGLVDGRGDVYGLGQATSTTICEHFPLT